MKETRIIMGMPVSIEIVDAAGADAEKTARAVFDYFRYVDEKFSTYKASSEIMAINRNELPREKWSEDMRLIFELAEETTRLTNGYFDIRMPMSGYDPSGIVKGWAIKNAADIAAKAGFKNFYVDAGGDIQTSGLNADGTKWSVGIKNPWNESENVKVAHLSGEGIATSGLYIRGDHIFNPKSGEPATETASLTVIGLNVYEADRFVTAAFAMGRGAIDFIESLHDKFHLEAYMIDNEKIATMTSGFARYTTT